MRFTVNKSLLAEVGDDIGENICGASTTHDNDPEPDFSPGGRFPTRRFMHTIGGCPILPTLRHHAPALGPEDMENRTLGDHAFSDCALHAQPYLRRRAIWIGNLDAARSQRIQ
jgi:hypothetical protein